MPARIDELLMQARSELLKRKPEYRIHIHIGELPDDEKQLTIYGKEHLLKFSKTHGYRAPAGLFLNIVAAGWSAKRVMTTAATSSSQLRYSSIMRKISAS